MSKSTKYNRTPHLSFSPGATKDDKIIKSHKDFIGVPIVITEKLDGSNTGITKDLVFGRSHVEPSKNPWDRVIWESQYLIKDYIPEGTFLFGENMYAIHSIEYKDLNSYFYLFGVRKDINIWASWDEVVEMSEFIECPTVPVLFEGVINSEKELKEIVEDLIESGSELGDTIEGIVIRVKDSFSDSEFGNKVAKWVRKDHVVTDQHWSRNWKRAELKY